jgi:small subunit ribosomal protein S7
MPRRTTVPRKLKYEVVPANKTIDRFVVKVMLSGKRGLAERILRETLERIETQANKPGLEVLDLALRNATPLIEVKPRRVGGATYQAARKRSGKSMVDKLAAEFMDASNNLGAAVKRREETHKMAEANKAFSHFRF